MAVTEQAAESLAASEHAVGSAHFVCRSDDAVCQPLVITLLMIVFEIVRKDLIAHVNLCPAHFPIPC